MSSTSWLTFCLDASQHASWAAELLARPALLQEVSPEAVARLYRHCRIGGPDQALQMLGAWARVHADVEPGFSMKFYQAERHRFRDLASRIIWDYRSHFDLLEDQYLELPDGGCSLTVAYTLSYGHWEEGRLLEWIDKLESRLEDDQLTGDRRVNWLLARAQAEEIRRGRPNRRWFTVERFMAGKGWLQEACLVAQSEPTKLRAYKEMVVRQAAGGQFEAARHFVQMAQERLTSPTSQEALASWVREIDGLVAKAELDRQRQKDRARQAYLETLERRLRRVEERGDQQKAARYAELIARAKAAAEAESPEEPPEE